MKVEIPVIISEDKLCECAFDEEKKLELAQEIANKSLRDIEFELYMATIVGGNIWTTANLNLLKIGPKQEKNIKKE